MSQETVRWPQAGQLLTHKMPEKPFRISFHIYIQSSYSKFYSGLFSEILAIKKRSWVMASLSLLCPHGEDDLQESDCLLSNLFLK